MEERGSCQTNLGEVEVDDNVDGLDVNAASEKVCKEESRQARSSEWERGGGREREKEGRWAKATRTSAD